MRPTLVTVSARNIRNLPLAKVEHPIRVIERQFSYANLHYRGLINSTAQLTTPFALSNL